MKKLLTIVFVLIIIFNANYVFALNGFRDGYQGQYYYRVTATTIADAILPIYESQTQHTRGITTTVSLQQTVTNGRSASSSLSIGGNFFLELSTQLGLTQYQSFSTTTSVAYTIDANTPTGKYRIEHVFPQSKLDYSRWDMIELTEERWSISYAPVRNAAYRRLTRYSN
ncbi:hypothetical protein [Anaerobranca gottschalkii]|uniref:Uncharacterized protein n=1 Tax=Anaerobranca gottschalkii DSM 13577 TaxID=1120990 RepID=A0A1H9ZXT3_9FIRM|nr:hypothetical protein [Anaerobranca gottschalkii]SES86202.1 hypothetical protein SAMN03080614_101420 [Anaerobranca gottschalkii DSM 13577]